MANPVIVVFEYSEEVAKNTHTFWFRPERPVRYIAGQFTELHLPHDNADNRGIRRWFTLSSSPTEQLLGITTKLAPKDGSTFKKQLANLQPGSALKLADPMGDFVLPKDPSIPLVFIATGLGITPVRSIIKWLHDQNQQRTVQILYTAPDPDELTFLPLLQRYPLSLDTRAKPGQSSRLQAAEIVALASNNALIYISGPEPVTERLYKALKVSGIEEERLVTDYFPGYTA